MSENRAIPFVEALTAVGSRGAGTDAERRGAEAVAASIRESGHRVELEPIHVHPHWPLVDAIHATLGVAGSLLATSIPALGFGLVLFAATSLYLDFAGRLLLLRRLTFRRASQNLLSPPRPDPERPRVLLCANLDSPRTGAAFNPGPTAALDRAWRATRGLITPRGLMFWSLALLLPPLGASMAGLDSGWLSLAQLPQTLILIVAAFLYAEAGLSPYSPGANSNASGVASALRAAELLDRGEPLERLDVQLALCGGGETGSQGVASHLRGLRRKSAEGRRRLLPRRRLPRPDLWVLELSATGVGEPTFAIRTAGAVTQSASPVLRELAALLLDPEAAGEGRDMGLPSAPPGAADAAGRLGYPSLMITARRPEDDYSAPLKGRREDQPERVGASSVEATAKLAEGIVRLLDRDLARRADGAAAQPEG